MRCLKPNEIIQKLKERGHEAFFVGGCVRDMLLGRDVHDWDITTSALPEQILECFEDSTPTGIRHGTVTVKVNGKEAEVTTYRADGIYLDGRHPESVVFVKNLSEDLARRDFTVNALAMDEAGNITDLFGGLHDLENQCIRCIGEPEVRFREDALRMLRAVRFSAQLDFKIEAATLSALERCAHLCEKLSSERIRDEMEKTLCSGRPERLEDMARYGLIDRCAPETDKSCKWLSELSPVPVVRWAGLCATWKDMDPGILHLDRNTMRTAKQAAACAVPTGKTEWKKRIVQYGCECCVIAAELVGQKPLVEEILESGECLSLRQLAVKGTDFPELSGPALGEHLNMLLMHVLEHPYDNRKERLLDLF